MCGIDTTTNLKNLNSRHFEIVNFHILESLLDKRDRNLVAIKFWIINENNHIYDF